MRKVILGLLFFGSPYLWAVENCPELRGEYQVKIEEAMVHLSVVETDCERFELTYKFPNESQLKRVYIPDGMERVAYEDGDREVRETARIHKLIIGDRYEKWSLQVERAELSRVYGHKTRTITEFYGEKSKTTKSLVERRDVFDEAGDRHRRVYIGYVDLNYGDRNP